MLISILVPIYGVEKYIKQCAVSLFEQDYPNIEFIFVNDGSPDKSITILEELIENSYPDLKNRIIIINKKNEGLPMARNTAIQHAKGEYVLNVDSDDWLEKNAISSLVKEIERTGADIVYFDTFKEFKNYKRKTSEKDYHNKDKFIFIRDIINYNTHAYICSKMFRRTLYAENNILVPKYATHEDIVFSTQLVYYANSVSYLHKALYHYRRTNESSITRSNKQKRRYESLKNQLDLYEYYKNHKNADLIKEIKYIIFYIAAKYFQMYDTNILKERSYLKAEIIDSPLIPWNCRVGIIRQIWAKIYLKYFYKKN